MAWSPVYEDGADGPSLARAADAAWELLLMQQQYLLRLQLQLMRGERLLWLQLPLLLEAMGNSCSFSVSGGDSVCFCISRYMRCCRAPPRDGGEEGGELLLH